MTGVKQVAHWVAVQLAHPGCTCRDRGRAFTDYEHEMWPVSGPPILSVNVLVPDQPFQWDAAATWWTMVATIIRGSTLAAFSSARLKGRHQEAVLNTILDQLLPEGGVRGRERAAAAG